MPRSSFVARRSKHCTHPVVATSAFHVGHQGRFPSGDLKNPFVAQLMSSSSSEASSLSASSQASTALKGMSVTTTGFSTSAALRQPRYWRIRPASRLNSP